MAAKMLVADKKKKQCEDNARNREFQIGDEVFVRKPGMNLKLCDSWEGPFKISKKNSPMSYAIDMGDRQIPSVHIQLIKKYNQENDKPRVGRITSMFEPDSNQDDILDRYSAVTVSGSQLANKQDQDIEEIEGKYRDILTKEPGLTSLTEFGIETVDSQPIFQRAYNTPAALRQSIDNEVDWLSEKKFIRPSGSP